MQLRLSAITALALVLLSSASAALPEKVLVGYWQNWSGLRLVEVHPAYNVIQLAFATTKEGSDCEMEFDLPWIYDKASFLADVDSLHRQGKSVVLSIGGAADPVILGVAGRVNLFVNSMDSILRAYDDKIDGIDLDLESTSMAVGSWTMSQPSQVQLDIINATQQIMARYRQRTGRKLVLTMAPENIYLQGALSSWQIQNINGGAFLPILSALVDSLDVIHPQYYNAGGAAGGVVAGNGTIYYDTGDPDFLTALTSTLIEGFNLLQGKGTFAGVPASKVAIGLPSNSCTAAGTGYVEPDSVSLALRYLRGEIAKPASFSYTLPTSYPDLRGLMTWSINEDQEGCDGQWSFAQGVEAASGTVPVLARFQDFHRSQHSIGASAAKFDMLGRTR